MDSQTGDDLTMNYENGRLVRAVNFDYDAIDGVEPEPVSDDDRFWKMQSGIFEELLRWLTEPPTDDGIGARLHALCAFLCPWFDTAAPIDQTLKDELNTALVRIQERFPPDAAFYQKIASLEPRRQWLRDRARRRKQAGPPPINAACRGS